MSPSFKHTVLLTALASLFTPVMAQPVDTLETIEASADASAEGLSPAFAGNQVAEGSRLGVLGNRHNLEMPFSTTAYTNDYIINKQARSVGEVLQHDPSVRVARGFGNFQESYFVRGFITSSDSTLYNGLYGLLPRQYIATELFERVELQRGASAFLNGMDPAGGSIGGTINLVPKRAPSQDLTRLSLGMLSGKNTRGSGAVDISRRFGENDQFGVRLNAAHHNGGTAIDDEKSRLSLIHLGLDWRGERARISADIGFQDNRLKETRTNVTITSLTEAPSAPRGSHNWAQPWTYSNEKDVFGTLRGEYDLTDNVTVYAAYGFRRSEEENSLANITLNTPNGNGSIYRFDNAREDRIHTGEIGIRGKGMTGTVSHDWVIAGNIYHEDRRNAYAMDFFNSFSTNLYNPTYYAEPSISGSAFLGGSLNKPLTTQKTLLRSLAIGNTFGFLEDTVLVTLGLRYQNILSRSYDYNTQALTSRYEESRWSPAVGIVYKFTPTLSVYANYIESLAPGDIAPTTSGGVAVRNAGESLNPYVSKQKEIGLKYQDHTFGAGMTFFSVDKPRTYLTPDVYYTSSGKDRHNGLELTAYGEITDGLRILGGATFLRAKQRETGSTLTDGKYTIGVPKVQANLGLEWDVPHTNLLTLEGNILYTGSRYANAQNTVKVGGWTRFDIGARYLANIAGKDVTFRLKVENLANKKYWASVGGYPGNGYLNAGTGRHISANVSLDF